MKYLHQPCLGNCSRQTSVTFGHYYKVTNNQLSIATFSDFECFKVISFNAQFFRSFFLGKCCMHMLYRGTDMVLYIAAPKSVVSELLRDTSLIDDATLAVEIDVVCQLNFMYFRSLYCISQLSVIDFVKVIDAHLHSDDRSVNYVFETCCCLFIISDGKGTILFSHLS